MAEETTSNGADGAATTSPAGPQELILNAQYIKDLSFENPRAPQSLIQQTAQPDVEINVDVKANNLGPELFEVPWGLLLMIPSKESAVPFMFENATSST